MESFASAGRNLKASQVVRSGDLGVVSKVIPSLSQYPNSWANSKKRSFLVYERIIYLGSHAGGGSLADHPCGHLWEVFPCRTLANSPNGNGKSTTSFA